MKDNKKAYTAPVLTVVTFKAERGYVLSGLVDQLMLWENDSQDSMENYETGNGWNSGNNHFWD